MDANQVAGLTANEAMDRIQDAIDAGKTVWASTSTRRVPFSPKSVAMLQKHGAVPFKVGRSGSLLMFDRFIAGAPSYVRASMGANGPMLVLIEIV